MRKWSKFFVLFMFCLSFTSCMTFNEKMNLGPDRYVSILIASKGDISQEKIQSFVDMFNEEAKDETGIFLKPEYIYFDIDRQAAMWPACQQTLPCFYDYLALGGHKHDIAIYIEDYGPAMTLANVILGFPIVSGTDNTQYRYMNITFPRYDLFKHEIYHAFHPTHTCTGLMFSLRYFQGIPTTTTSLSDESRKIILANKWRKFEDKPFIGVVSSTGEIDTLKKNNDIVINPPF